MTPSTPSSKNRANAPLSRLYELRTDAGWTVIQLAVYADVAKGTVERIEAAESELDLDTLERTEVRVCRQLAKALDVPVREVFPWLLS